MKKYRSQRLHAKKRFLERCGIKLTTKDLDNLRSQIVDGNAELIRKQSNRVSVWKINFNGTEVEVVYDKNTKNIVTVLPNE